MSTPPALEPALSRGLWRLSHATAALVVILLTTSLLLIFLGTGDPTNTMELFNLVPVREAYRDGHWFMPTLNGLPRFEKPPLCVWIPAALATLVGNDSLWVVRLPSLLMAIVTGLATYTLGCQIFRNLREPRGGERKYALFAAVAVLTMFAFDQQARLASYDIYATGFTLLSAAFLVMLAEQSLDDAGQPRRLSRAKWFGFTAISGFSLGCSLLSKGPAPAATIMLPVIIWLLVFHRRGTVFRAVAAVIVLSLLVALPWVFAILVRYPGAWPLWKSEFIRLTESKVAGAPQIVLDTRRPWYYYFLIFVWTAPYIPLFIAGLCLPFLRTPSGRGPSMREQRGRMLAWLVVVVGLVMLSLPSVKELRYAIQIFPFAALLCAAVGQEFLRLRPVDKIDLPGGILLVAQALFFLVPALGGLVLITGVAAQWSWPAWAGGNGPVAAVKAMGLFAGFALAAALLVGGSLLWRWLYRRQFGRGALVLMVCAWLLALAAQWSDRAVATHHANVWRPGIERAIALVGAAPVFTFPSLEMRPWLSTLYYFNRSIPGMSPEQIAARAATTPAQPFYVLAITSAYGKTIAGADAQIAQVARLTGRRADIAYVFTDEKRETEVVRFAPPFP